jgi:hypothetical protein
MGYSGALSPTCALLCQFVLRISLDVSPSPLFSQALFPRSTLSPWLVQPHHDALGGLERRGSRLALCSADPSSSNRPQVVQLLARLIHSLPLQLKFSHLSVYNPLRSRRFSMEAELLPLHNRSPGLSIFSLNSHHPSMIVA